MGGSDTHAAATDALATETTATDARLAAGDLPRPALVPGDVQPVQRLARPPLGYRRELEGLRGVAVAAVLVYHFGVLLWPGGHAWMAPGGQVGVDLFFVLSGFLITVLLLEEHARDGRVDVRRFLWRRVRRLVPALAAMMAALLAVSLVTDRYDPGHVLSSAGLVMTFSTNLALRHSITEVGHTWSLSVEAHFYVLWCLVAALVTGRARRPHRVLGAIAVGAVVAVVAIRAIEHASGQANPAIMYTATLYRLDAPLVGALAGVGFRAGWFDRIPGRVAAWAGAIALALFAVAAFRARPLSPAQFRGLFTAVALCAAVAVVALVLADGGLVRRLIRARPTVGLGKISYSVYLWHAPLFYWLARNAGPWPIAVKAAVAASAALGAGALSYAVVERRFLRHRPLAAPVPALAAGTA